MKKLLSRLNHFACLTAFLIIFAAGFATAATTATAQSDDNQIVPSTPSPVDIAMIATVLGDAPVPATKDSSCLDGIKEGSDSVADSDLQIVFATNLHGTMLWNSTNNGLEDATPAPNENDDGTTKEGYAVPAAPPSTMSSTVCQAADTNTVRSHVNNDNRPTGFVRWEGEDLNRVS